MNGENCTILTTLEFFTPNNMYEKLKAFEGKKFTESQSAAGQGLQYILEKVTPGSVTLKLTVLESMTNPWKQLHGGIFALIMDEAVGIAFYTVCKGEYYTTVNLNVEHLMSAAIGETLYATGTVIRHGKKIAYTEGSIYNGDNQLICRATSNLVNTGKRIFAVDAS
jgi:acyl-coenzyme A thioesterase 13